MHRRHYYLYIQAAIILTLIIMAGYIMLYLYSTSNGDNGFKLTSDACHELEGVCRTSCNGNEVPKTECGEGMSCCVEVFAASPRDRLYYKDAEGGKNISLCNQIVDAEMKASCKLRVMDMLSQDFALKYRDSGYCRLIEDDAQMASCMMSLAKLQQEISLCDEIEALNFKYKCIGEIAMAKRDGMICLNIPSEIQQNLCLKDIAIINKEPGICDQITMPTEVMDCKMRIELIMMKKDYVNCVELPESACINTKGCTAAYFAPGCEGCGGKRFEICLPDNDMFCENTFGDWNVLEEKCSCNGKAWFDGFGCYGCDSFKAESSIKECESRLAQSF